MLSPEQFRLMRARQAAAHHALPPTSKPKDAPMIHLLRLRFADPAEPNKLSGIELDALEPTSLDCVVRGYACALDVAPKAAVAVDSHPAMCTPGYWQDQVLAAADQLASVLDDMAEIQSTARYVTQSHAYEIAVRLRRVHQGNQGNQVPDPPAGNDQAPQGNQQPAQVPPVPRQAPPAPRPQQPQVNQQRR